MDIALLYGGISSEREVSIMSFKSVERSLKRLGHTVTPIDIKDDFLNAIKNTKFDLAFIALHGRHGEDGCIQGMLEIMQIPYTHSGVLACSLCMNKNVAKSIFKQLGIDTANGRMLTKEEILKNKILHPKKHVIKSVDQGSSIDVYIVEDEHKFTRKNYPFQKNPMLEEFIKGREVQVAVVAGEPIGVIEIIPTEKDFYDYKTKYTKGMARHICPANIPQEIYKKCLSDAKKVYDFLNCKGICRADFIYDESISKLVMLELNTHPGFTDLSLVPEIAKKCKNIDFDQIVQIIINDALTA